MEAADILYGVTMGADGVSQIVSRRLRAKPSPRSLSLAMTTWSALLGDEERDEEQAAEPGFFGRLRDSLGKSRRALTGSSPQPPSTRPTTRPGSGSRRR